MRGLWYLADRGSPRPLEVALRSLMLSEAWLLPEKRANSPAHLVVMRLPRCGLVPKSLDLRVKRFLRPDKLLQNR